MTTTECAPLFDALYGEKEAERVYQMLEGLDPILNEAVQNIAYNYFWELPGLSIRDKSLITVATLFALGKEPQIRPHMIGFLNTGGKVEELLGALLSLSQFDKKLLPNILATLQEILQKKDFSTPSVDFLTKFQLALEDKNTTAYSLNTRDRHFVHVAANVALYHPEKITRSMLAFLADNCEEQDLRRLLIHQIVYCGFPTVINAFTLLQKILVEKHISSCSK